MAKTIVVAGGTGNLGRRIIKALLERGAAVRAIVRPESDPARLENLEQQGIKVIPVDMSDTAALSQALKEADAIVSALSGLRDVIVDTQAKLLKTAIVADVPRFISSDYAADFTKTTPGTNRNFDLRREFHEQLDQAPIAATSILNGAFADMLTHDRMPLLSLKEKRVSYYGEADQLLDFTTMDNTAEFTAEAALDSSTPRVLRVAGDSVSPRGLANIASKVTNSRFELVRSGSVNDLSALIQKMRAADPAGETKVFPVWQGMQYMFSMFTGEAKLQSLDNNRYPNIKWTTTQDLLEAAKQPE